MSTSRNDRCPCGSGRKYKKCCLNAPDPQALRRSRILLYGSLILVALTVAAFLVAGRGVGSAVGMGSFALVIGYVLAGGPPPSTGKGAPPKGPPI